MTFLGDEGRDAFVVYDILHGKPTLLGPTASVGGFFLGPIYYYFMAPFLWLFNYNPVGPAVMVALFGVATVWLVYKAGSEFFSEKVGIIAALLYAISPIVIAYSRSSWNPNLMPFFSLLSLFVVYNAVAKKNNLLFLLCGFLLGIALQLHYLTIFLSFIIGIYILCDELWLQYIKKAKLFGRAGIVVAKQYLFILGGLLAGWLPFFLFEVRHGFPNIQSIAKFIFFSGDTGTNMSFFPVVMDVFFRLFGRLATAFPPPEQISVRDSVVAFDLVLERITIPATPFYLFTLFLGIFSASLFLWKFYLMLREKKENIQIQLLVFLWFSLGIMLFGFYKKPIYDYYFGFLFPLPFLLIGNALWFLWQKRNVFSLVAVGIFIILLTVNLQGIPFRSGANRQLAQMQTIANFVLSKTEGKPYNFAIISGGNSDHAYRYFFRLAGKDPVEIKKPYEDFNRNSVTNQLFVVCEGPCSPPGNPAWEISGFGRAEIMEKWDVSVVRVYKLVHYKKQ
ncbi:MAG: glycosyltransferase family 39 protein [Candidatus Levyibacteriota bacterium]|nr:MAG: glycosyltransferase family 39 protein [Candidatus Levybacteria bacterium]